MSELNLELKIDNLVSEIYEEVINLDKSTIGRKRRFNITAFSVPIVYNKYGDYDPNGMIYALSEEVSEIEKEVWNNFNREIPQPTESVQPLVIRVNVGEYVEIYFTNKLDRPASIHIQGNNYNVNKSDGTNVGFNKTSIVPPKKSFLYKWKATNEGIYMFNDMADPRSSELASNVHGMFGAIIVEKVGSTWTDPVTGCESKRGLFADIHNPVEKSFREFCIFFHDELEVVDKDGKVPLEPFTNMPSDTMGVNYRSEPMRNRHEAMDMNHMETSKMSGEQVVVSGEENSMSSWSYGDPAIPILKAYKNDPTKIRLIHGGIKETHVFHLHTHQWRLDPNNPNSTIIDSISISPQESYTIDIVGGAGSTRGAIGDSIWHCHLYPHFHHGMWSLFRVYDRLELGDGRLPDGTLISKLEPLPDRPLPPSKDENHPGYPNFINSVFPDGPTQPPLGILTIEGKNKIFPSRIEYLNFVNGFSRGALYSNTCSECRFNNKSVEDRKCFNPPCRSNEVDVCDNGPTMDKVSPDVVFEVAAVQARIVYNKSGWHDPQGRFFVLLDDIEKAGGLKNYLDLVNSMKIKVEPLVIRANAGQCIEVRLTNLLPKYIGGNAFQLITKTEMCSYHIHLVKFDPINSDGSSNGWNHTNGAFCGETIVERFFANEELNTVFFHDHLNANSHQQHGLFGAMIIEPKGAKYFHPKTGKTIKRGTKAVIRTPDGKEFREFVLAVHDFALLFDKFGVPLNPPPFPGSDEDPGVMGINYRSEPLRERLNDNDDPSEVFNSKVHGDPVTPILEAYQGDSIVIRLLQGAHEEQHSFNINGMSWRKEIDDPNSPLVSSQTIGISEAFNIKIDGKYPKGDYLYHFGSVDDIWLGLWGIIRLYDKESDKIKPLCSNSNYNSKINVIPGESSTVRRYHIAAVQSNIKYNEYGDHDPNGLVFVPYYLAESVSRGKVNPKPLILRANAGDYIEITLTNLFDNPIEYEEYPGVPVDKVHTPSMRVSLSPQFLMRNIDSGGVNIGFNNVRDQTVGPGESITYMWHADKEYGACLINSFGDMRNHRLHGLFGAIIIEPQGSIYEGSLNSANNSLPRSSEQALIKSPGKDRFREFVVFLQNGIRLLDEQGNIIKTTEEDEEAEIADFEDRGEKGINYRSERFLNRLKEEQAVENVFSSKIHGDPSTPIFLAKTNERVIMRVIMPGDKPRNISFALHGHLWLAQLDDPFTREIAIQGAISVGNSFNIEFITSKYEGDYLYRSGSLKWDIESGMWGILRIKE